MSGKVRILIADDHPVYRDGLRLNLDDWEEGMLVGVAAASGQAIFGSAVAARLTALFDDLRRQRRPFPDLTERERDVLELVAQGRSNPDIARRLGISEKTVRNHVSTIFAKLEVLGRPEAIVRAREAGMGGGSPRPS